MNRKEKDILNSLGVYMTPRVTKKYNHKHGEPDEWTRFYYYKNRQPFKIPGSSIMYDAEVTSTNSLHRNTFYKMAHLSNSDLFYDYYFCLKPEVGQVVIKEKKLKRNIGNKISNSINLNINKIVPKPLPRNNLGQILVEFD